MPPTASTPPGVVAAATAPVRLVRARVVFDSPRVRVRRDDVLFAGSPGDYTVVEACDYAVVAAVENGGVWLVEQFRYAIGRRSWELPAGTWPVAPDATGFVGGVRGDLAELAAAELVEETGMRADHLDPLGSFFPSIGCSRQRAHAYLARGLHHGPHRREVTEQDMVARWFPADTARAMVRDGDIVDLSSALTLGLALDRALSTPAGPPLR